MHISSIHTYSYTKDIDFPNLFIVGDLNDNYMIATCPLCALVNNYNLTKLIKEPMR